MIFIAYRRSDTAFLVGRLADRLIQSFGSDAVFHDVRSVRPGDDFVGLSEATVRSSKVVLAVVGDGWLSLQDGVRRIDRPDDYLRIELENALRSRPNTCVIPVYTSDNCVLTTKTGLPAALEPLCQINGLLLRPGVEFDDDVRRLLAAIRLSIWPSIFPRLARFVVWQLRRRKLVIGAFFAMTLSLILLGDRIAPVLVGSPRGVAGVVRKLDPYTFHSPVEDAPIEVARVLSSRRDLIENTDLAQSISETHQTLDVFAPTAVAILTNDELLLTAIRRGVRVRFLIVDHSASNDMNLVDYYSNRVGNGDTLEEGRRKYEFVLQRAARLVRESNRDASGSFELRLWRGPFMNSLWIRDGSMPESRLAHVELGFFGDTQLCASIRIGRLSPESASAIQTQFETMWTAGAQVEAGFR